MNARILLVSSLERRPRLLELLNAKGLEIYLAAGVGEARRRLSTAICFDLLFVDVELADGFWQDLAQYVLDSQRICEVIVCSRWFDARLWAEVINCGAFDLIAEPHEELDILRIIETALNRRHTRKFARTKPPKVSAMELLSAAEPVARTA